MSSAHPQKGEVVPVSNNSETVGTGQAAGQSKAPPGQAAAPPHIFTC